MNWGLLRIAAQLRRIAKAIERSNELYEERHPVVVPRKPRPAQISVPTVASWNAGYERRQRGEEETQ